MSREVDRKFILRENYMREDAFQEAVKDKKREFAKKYPNADVNVKWYKHGCRLTVRER